MQHKHKQLIEDMTGALEKAVIIMKLTRQSKETWLHNMGQLWDDTDIPDDLFDQSGNA